MVRPVKRNFHLQTMEFGFPDWIAPNKHSATSRSSTAIAALAHDPGGCKAQPDKVFFVFIQDLV
jgi:hypothetical protein